LQQRRDRARFYRDIEQTCRDLGITLEPVAPGGKWHSLSFQRRVVYVQLDKLSLSLETHSSRIVLDKLLTRHLLSKRGECVIQGYPVTSVEDVEGYLESQLLHYPVVIKPVTGHRSIGVLADIRSKPELEDAFEGLRYQGLLGEKLLAEPHIPWTDVSVLVVEGIYLAASVRCPPSVLGDGVHTIADLSAQLNIDMSSAETQTVLDHQGLSLHSCPSNGTVVRVLDRRNNELGTARDITDIIHNSYKDVAQRCAAVVGSRVASVDLFVKNSDPSVADEYVINEVNYGASLLAYMYPDEGAGRAVHVPVLKAYFEIP